ncbi:hypothetical protein [Kutzneria sp. CA-103260]|uniref:hypothetical protein n=1 Tax=Kutzneria sp. CA-103260 TaxID=2802641 RepID=UPI001BA7B7ED|nr:hypothetical protein [Kutzneria sp. CA-103260]QUQ63189.1 hypothetical protein JJ691_09010 [Kutzneria sp. CA-103260]
MLSGRNLLIIATLLVCVVVVVMLRTPGGGTAKVDLDAEVSEFADALSPDAPYRPPGEQERTAALDGLMPLLTGGTDLDSERKPLTPLGFTVSDGVDEATGRHFVLASTKPDAARGWGMYIADYGARPRLVIEVPHPNFDLNTEQVGIELYRRVPGSAVLVAGAHRKAGDNTADVAHNADSLFNTVAVELAKLGLPQVQLHGFDDRSLPDTDVVVSSGSTPHTAAHERIADRLTGQGLAVCRVWEQSCGNLEGRRNVQGNATDGLGGVFVHIESASEVRARPELRSRLVDALTGMV